MENDYSTISKFTDVKNTSSDILKLLSLIGILFLAVLFGLIPAFFKGCRRRVRILGLANVFNGGIFLGTSLFQLLPLSNRFMDLYIKQNYGDSKLLEVPLAYFVCFASFSLILFIEKVTFDSKVLAPFDVKKEDIGNTNNLVDDEKQDKDDKEIPLNDKSNKKPSKSNEDEKSDSDEEEEVFKNILSTKGKMASFLQQQRVSIGGNDDNTNNKKKQSRSLLRSSQIIRSFTQANKPGNKEDLSLFTNPKNVHVNNKINTSSETEEYQRKPMASFTPYLLIVAISLHGLFEGLSLGLQPNDSGCLFLIIAIVLHKCVDAFTLGLALMKANTEKTTIVRLILLFSLFTPFGILIGFLLDHQNYLIISIFMGMSAGTFMYISTSDIIVEEFSFTQHRYTKFFLYVLGGVFIASLIASIKLHEDSPFGR